MGKQLYDRYSVLHFLTGALAFQTNLRFLPFMIGHTLFELAENSSAGIAVLRKIPFWPGGKEHADSLLNMIGDTLAASAGYSLAMILDDLYQIRLFDAEQQAWFDAWRVHYGPTGNFFFASVPQAQFRGFG